LAVVASIIEEKISPNESVEASLISVARLGSDFLTMDEAADAGEPTPSERALAQSLREEARTEGEHAGQAMAELLLLAHDHPAAGELSAALSQAFLLPDGSRPALARDGRASTFADLYRGLVLHQLNSQVRNKAAERLGACWTAQCPGGSTQVATVQAAT
jgi:hypothetical protein